MNKIHFFAIDLGATSGRTILGTLCGKEIKYEELTRFPNHIIHATGHCYWDIYALYNEIIRGLRIVSEKKIRIESIGIDTWGVDFVCIDKGGELIRQPYCYRDPMTEKAPEDYFNKVSRKELYDITGIQVLNFNTLYQLHVLNSQDNTALREADKILFVPDALAYLLTGEKVTEYTIASTSQMLDVRKREFSDKLLSSVGVSASQFGSFVQPGEQIGVLSNEVRSLTGLGAVPVIAVAEHDTGSAVVAVPAAGSNFAYLSSGTWSLMGIETKKPIVTDESLKQNFTNEGGAEGTIRFLKNICGMWLLESCRREWRAAGSECSYPELIDAAMKTEAFRSLINPDAPCFANPQSMTAAIKEYCRQTGQLAPETQGEFARCIFESLALRYKQVFTLLQEMAPFRIGTLHIIGGGSRNNHLNRFTCNAIGIPVVAGPDECTALGNILLQAKAAGEAGSLDDMREVVRNSVSTKRFEPEEQELWNKAYESYLSVFRTDI